MIEKAKYVNLIKHAMESIAAKRSSFPAFKKENLLLLGKKYLP